MQAPAYARKKLVLLGGGHAHVHVIKTLISNPIANTDVTLITPTARQVYSGMLPGWIAGHYVLDDCVIPLVPLAHRSHRTHLAGVSFVEAAATRIHTEKNSVICHDGTRIAYDVLSVDTGSVAHFANIPGAREHALAIRPIERFIVAIGDIKDAIRARSARGESSHIAVIGAGAGGVEIALALQHAISMHATAKVTLISAANTLPDGVGAYIKRALSQAGIRLYAGVAAASIAPNQIMLADGRIVNADFIVVALGAAAAAWPRESGLQCDDAGYILTNRFLQSVSHGNVFAAGDCATMQDFPRPKSGVYAVRAGPPLAENLRRAMNGTPLKAYLPQSRSLYLISTGSKHAIGAWGAFAWAGDWVWRWKDRIDRRFIAQYRG